MACAGVELAAPATLKKHVGGDVHQDDHDCRECTKGRGWTWQWLCVTQPLWRVDALVREMAELTALVAQ